MQWWAKDECISMNCSFRSIAGLLLTVGKVWSLGRYVISRKQLFFFKGFSCNSEIIAVDPLVVDPQPQPESTFSLESALARGEGGIPVCGFYIFFVYVSNYVSIWLLRFPWWRPTLTPHGVFPAAQVNMTMSDSESWSRHNLVGLRSDEGMGHQCWPPKGSL